MATKPNAVSNIHPIRTLRNAAQNPISMPSGGGGPSNPQQPPPTGGDPMIDIAGLKKNVGFLNWVAAACAGALIALYFILSGQIDHRFDKADEKISHISDQMSDLRVSVGLQGSDVKAILEKVDARESTPSAATESAKQVRGQKGR